MTSNADRTACIVCFEDGEETDLAVILLEESGYRVICCDDADGVLSALSAESGAVAMVVAGHGMIGAEDVRRMRERWPEVEVVVAPRRSGAVKPGWRPLDLLIAAEAARSRPLP